MQLIILQVIDRFRDTRGCKPTLSFTRIKFKIFNHLLKIASGYFSHLLKMLINLLFHHVCCKC